MTKKGIYYTFVPLIADINKTAIGKKIFEAAKTGSGMKVVEVISRFKREHTFLYKRMYEFKRMLDEIPASECEIFGIEENEEEGIFIYDPEKINASSLFAFSYFTGFDESTLFSCTDMLEDCEEPIYSDIDVFYSALEKESGSSNFAQFAAIAFFNEEQLAYLAEEGLVYDNKYELLVDVFAGKVKAYLNE